MSKAQFSVEFIFLFALLMFVFVLILVAADQFMQHQSNAEEQKKLDSVGEIIKKELLLAKQSPTEFESIIKLPKTVDGTGYRVHFDDTIMIIDHGYLNVSVIKEIPQTTLPASNTLIPGDCYFVRKASTGELSIVDTSC